MTELINYVPKEALASSPVNKGLCDFMQTMYDFDKDAPDLLLKQAEAYFIPVQRWEAVRKSRGPAILNIDGSATGFEGYLYGAPYGSDQFAYFIATYTQNELDRHVKNYPLETSLRRRMDNALFDRKYSDLGALKHLEGIFNNIRVFLYRDHIIMNKKEGVDEANKVFKLETDHAVRNTPKPKILFNPDNGTLEQEMVIPKIATIVSNGSTLGIPIPRSGFEIAREIGIVGNPLLRAALSNQSLVKYMELLHPSGDRVNLAPRRSDLFKYLRDNLHYRFLTDIIEKKQQ